MTATAKKKSSVSKTRINEFKERFIVPFTGTLKKPYEITSVKGDSKRPSEDSIIEALPEINDYLKTGKSPVTFEGLHLVFVSSEDRALSSATPVAGVSSRFAFTLLAINPETNEVTRFEPSDGIPYHTPSNEVFHYFKEHQDSVREWFIDDSNFMSHHNSLGALIVDGHLLINADENATNDHEFVSSGEFDEHPTLSFNCLANLIAKEVVASTEVDDIIRKANLKVVDFTPEQRKGANKTLKAAYNKAVQANKFNFVTWAANQTPPEAGFSLIDGGDPIEWHKSSTIVLRNGKESYILGQDEGTYFGCVLADNPKDIPRAYESLMPASARGVKGVLRQGEWFAIPVKNQKQVPDRYSPDTLMFADNADGDITGICFGIEDADSNRHYFDSGEIIFARSGIYARNFEICHEEHATLSGEDGVWYTFAKNTALHSFSAERVD